jgi:hypothetical protein
MNIIEIETLKTIYIGDRQCFRLAFLAPEKQLSISLNSVALLSGAAYPENLVREIADAEIVFDDIDLIEISGNSVFPGADVDIIISDEERGGLKKRYDISIGDFDNYGKTRMSIIIRASRIFILDPNLD